MAGKRSILTVLEMGTLACCQHVNLPTNDTSALEKTPLCLILRSKSAKINIETGLYGLMGLYYVLGGIRCNRETTVWFYLTCISMRLTLLFFWLSNTAVMLWSKLSDVNPCLTEITHSVLGTMTSSAKRTETLVNKTYSNLLTGMQWLVFHT